MHGVRPWNLPKFRNSASINNVVISEFQTPIWQSYWTAKISKTIIISCCYNIIRRKPDRKKSSLHALIYLYIYTQSWIYVWRSTSGVVVFRYLLRENEIHVRLINVLCISAVWFRRLCALVYNNPSSKTSGCRLGRRRCLEHGRPPAVCTHYNIILSLYSSHASFAGLIPNGDRNVVRIRHSTVHKK